MHQSGRSETAPRARTHVSTRLLGGGTPRLGTVAEACTWPSPAKMDGGCHLQGRREASTPSVDRLVMAPDCCPHRNEGNSRVSDGAASLGLRSPPREGPMT
jgi:hypothetical protein